ncbi:efflux RND transporter permease subunit [Tenuifilum thalassicum]|uniref:Efflux RND transporter permease subunit n=1 Tax=Tenuifilum thalassicum TaxID=2590900 RepID=A0A7D3XYH9_9BACT|nr:efflux RND transporter permease subunit [Tenuifilum thalassicum]QKG79193.1 efflux RND transporter permease subunit [Tenuifilum thalassicum]
MVRYLINRPIAVIMVYLAMLLLGIYSVFFIPVSLLPDIDAPEVTVKADYPGKLAKEIEQSVTAPLRFQLQQVGNLESLESETRDNEAVISLRFKYGTNGERIFFDVNEKVDLAMSTIPREVSRPRVIRASLSDLPVFNVNITYKDTAAKAKQLLELSQLTRFVLQKRLEQLPEVAFADASGFIQPEIRITPNQAKLDALGISYAEIAEALNNAMYDLGSIRFKQGQMVFDVTFESSIVKPEDIGNVLLSVSGRVFNLNELVTIETLPRTQQGTFLLNGKPGVNLAILKTSNGKVSELKQSVINLLDQFRTDYPELEFSITNDQSYILNLSIGNLRNSLILGLILAIGVMFLFMGSYRSPLLMAVTIPVSLVISMFFFHILGLSVNIISLAGLILGVGMMIDNSIVVIDNINQWQKQNIPFEEAVVKGTNEVVTPLLSSMLTTCSVFLPLIFLSGIAGEMFYDQAVAVSIGLIVSFWVSITLMPTLYFNLHQFKKIESARPIVNLKQPFLRGHFFVERHKGLILSLSFALVLGLPIIFKGMDKQQIPSLSHNELMARITWGNNVSFDENLKNMLKLESNLKPFARQIAAYVGRQQFLLIKGFEQEEGETILYIELKKGINIDQTTNAIQLLVKQMASNARVSFTYPETAFDRIFPNSGYTLIAKFYPGKNTGSISKETIQKMKAMLLELNESQMSITSSDSTEQIALRIIPERLLLYQVDLESVINAVSMELGTMQLSQLNFEQQTLPISYGNKVKKLTELIDQTRIRNSQGIQVPIKELIDVQFIKAPRTIKADGTGVYVPLYINTTDDNAENVVEKLKSSKSASDTYTLGVEGEYFKSRNTMAELLVVLLVSVMLLYFILAAQFESAWQPLVVLIELPIDFSLALLALWLFGGSINLMSLIGLVVMGGIVINDSILKIDTINRLLKNGMGIDEAIEKAGIRRVKAIVMTSATTILAMLPILFGTDIGSELQQPMAITIMGGMFLGTMVSLFIVPLLYKLLFGIFSINKNKMG